MRFACDHLAKLESLSSCACGYGGPESIVYSCGLIDGRFRGGEEPFPVVIVCPVARNLSQMVFG